MGSTVRYTSTVLVAACLVFASLSSNAAPPDTPAPYAEAVQKYFDEGIAAGAADRFDDAARAFRAAWALSTNSAIACNLGRVEFRRKNYPAAAEFLTRCTAAAPSAGKERQRAEAVSELKLALTEVGALQVNVADPHAEIVVDDHVVGHGGAPATYFVSPGEHRVEASVGDASAATTVELHKGGSRSVTLTPQRTTKPAQTETPSVDIATETSKDVPLPGVPDAAPPNAGRAATKPRPVLNSAPVEGATSHRTPDTVVLITGGATVAATLSAALVFTLVSNEKRTTVLETSRLIPQTKLTAACINGDIRGVCGARTDARAAWATFDGLALAAFIAGGVVTTATGTLLITSKLSLKPAVTVGGVGVVGTW